MPDQETVRLHKTFTHAGNPIDLTFVGTLVRTLKPSPSVGAPAEYELESIEVIPSELWVRGKQETTGRFYTWLFINLDDFHEAFGEELAKEIHSQLLDGD